MRRPVLLCFALTVIALQGCAGIEVKPPDEFGYRRNWNPPA